MMKLTILIKRILPVIFFMTTNFANCQQTSLNSHNDKRIINLSLNENPFPPSEGIKDSLLTELPNIYRYAAKDGEEFVKQVAIHEGVSAEQIIPGEILELLGIYLGIKGGAGSEFIYSVPGYPALVNAAATVGGKTISIPLNDRLENNLEAILVVYLSPIIPGCALALDFLKIMLMFRK